VQWVAVGSSSGATFCIVAKLPASTLSADQVLFGLSPLFALAREGAEGADLVFTVSGIKGIVKGAFDGRWHSFVTTTSDNTSIIYVDGVERGSIKHLLGAPVKNTNAVLASDVRQLMAWRSLLAQAELGSLHNQLKSKWKL
jgi:hypothetical protein